MHHTQQTAAQVALIAHAAAAQHPASTLRHPTPAQTISSCDILAAGAASNAERSPRGASCCRERRYLGVATPDRLVSPGADPALSGYAIPREHMCAGYRNGLLAARFVPHPARG